MSQMCFGSLQNNSVGNKVIDLTQCTQTKLGKKVLKYFEGHTSLNGYNTELEIIDKNQSGPSPVQLIGDIRANHLAAFDDNIIDSIVYYMNSLYKKRDGKDRDKIFHYCKYA